MIWFWVYYTKAPIYPIFYPLKGGTVIPNSNANNPFLRFSSDNGDGEFFEAGMGGVLKL